MIWIYYNLIKIRPIEKGIRKRKIIVVAAGTRVPLRKYVHTREMNSNLFIFLKNRFNFLLFLYNNILNKILIIKILKKKKQSSHYQIRSKRGSCKTTTSWSSGTMGYNQRPSSWLVVTISRLSD